MEKLPYYVVSLVAVLVCVTVDMTNAQAGTLGFYLNGMAYPDGSTVLRTDIGEEDNALQCTTDSTTCCRNDVNGEIRAGNFFFPNDGQVPISTAANDGYYRNRLSRLIRLHRQPTGTITGQFRCVIPQGGGLPEANLTINIVDISVSISPSGDNTAGDAYSLACSATVIGSIDTPNVAWLDAMNNTVPTGMVSVMGNVHTLTFNPLSASHAEVYTCRAALGGAVQTESMEVTVENPKITVSVAADVTPMVGSVHSLTCTVTGAEMLTNPMVTYQWFKNDVEVSGQTMETLSFSPLTFSDAGQYTCALTLSSSILSSTISKMSDPFNVTLSLPNPTMVNIASNPASPVTSGVNVTLTCTAELSPELASIVSISVTTTWIGPSGMQISGSVPMMAGNSPSTYTSTLMLIAVASDGIYTCLAMTSSSSQYLTTSGSTTNTIMITVDEVPTTTAAATQAPTTTVEANITTTETQTNDTTTEAITTETMTTEAMTTEMVSTGVQMTTAQTTPTSPPPPSITVVSITPSGTATAGDTYNLVCSVTVTGSTDTPTITWLDDGVEIHVPSTDPTRMVSMTTGSTGSYSSTLMFNPLAASHAGTYTCRATLDGAMDTETINVTVQNPTIAVSIASSVATPMVGSMYTLNCGVTGDEKLSDATTTHQWFKNGEVLSNQTIQTLSFQSLAISDAGSYTCGATVMSSLLIGPITATATNSVNVTLSLPIPMVVITSTPTSPIRPIGSTVTLTCIVELSPAVDVPVTVTAQLSGHAGVTVTPVTNSVIENTTTYTSTAMISSFGRNQSGEYTCTATVNLVTANPFIIDSMDITGMNGITIGTGVYLSLRGTVYANNSVIPITEIGETNPDTTLNEGLQCITDRMPCCRNAFRTGEWYMYTSDRTMVPGPSTSVSFYRNRGYDDGTVNLNRNAGVTMPTGLFCCEVPDTNEDVRPICANIVSYSVVITPTGTSTAGETFSLNCSVNGTTDPTTYQWFEGTANSGTQLINVSQLEFSPLRASHTGLYTCQATVGGVMVEGTTTVEVNLPAPTSVTVTPPMGTIFAGSSPNLTCTVELSPAVDIPVTVTTRWNVPEGTMFLPTNPVPAVMVNLTTYTSTVMVDAARNGSYTCQATVTSGGTMSGSATITVAPLPRPTILMATSPSPTSITLTWEQTEGADAVDSYEINYQYIVKQCIGEGGSFPAITVMEINGSLRSYTLTNSALTPVEEDSLFSISLTAVNDVEMSASSESAMTATAEAAPGLVQSLNVSSVNVTGITSQWDRVDCQERNGPTDSYRVVFYPTSSPSDTTARTLVGIEDNDRMFSVTGLPPRTSYTFEVQASNTNIDMRGAPAIYTADTTAPQNLGFLLNGQLYPNNSVVTVTDIGGSFFMSALFCLTPSLECCSDSETPNAASVTREWYLPDGRQLSSTNSPFITSQVSSAVSLHCNAFSSITAPTGVFRCEIPDASGMSQNIYVGIYPERVGVGSPSITSVIFDRNSTTLTCTSTGGPPTTVTWRKNDVPINESLYEQSQRLVNTVTATYENVLFNDNVANFVGAFTCGVSNVRGTDEVTRELNGITIVHDLFKVGESATARCISDTPATRIEWLNEEDEVVLSATSTEQLDLVFSLVNDSIHDRNYVCNVTRVTRDGGMIGTQNFTVDVIVPSTAINATVSSSGTARAGVIYNLTCTVSKTVDGLSISPTATWMTTGGVAVSNGNGITVSTRTMDETAVSTLTFDPLRTSHGGRYSCNGTLTSPALDSPLSPSTRIEHNVQISTPDVNITVPSGPLFAGSTTPLTLTCTISINNATDTDVSVTANMDVTWMRGTTELPDGDARVTISSVSGSRPLFTSILTLDPLSIVDNTTFTCQARARPPANQQSFIDASELGVMTLSVIVNLPSPPTVSITPFNNVTLAGQSLTLNCSASIQDGIRGTPTLMWTRVDDVLTIEATSEPPLLSFSSLRTSHAGRYTCTARLAISEAGVDVSGANTTGVSVQIPQPMLVISGSPRDEGFFAGLANFSFTCSATLNPSVDPGVTVSTSWERNGSPLISTDGIMVGVASSLVGLVSNSSVMFTSLGLNDAGNYTCRVNVTAVDSTFILGTTNSTTRDIVVENFPVQEVQLTSEGSSIAGHSLTLICRGTREPLLAASLEVEWLGPGGTPIQEGSNITITGPSSTTEVSLTSTLMFDSLRTSQGGPYTCRMNLTIVEQNVTDHPVSKSSNVIVQLPAPIYPFVIRESRSGVLYEGTTFSWICVITPNTTGVDTDFTISSTVVGPRTPDMGRIIISPPVEIDNVYETNITFRALRLDDNGTYNCSASATSSLRYVSASELTTEIEMIAVTALPLPVVNITATPNPTAGQAYTLDCSARTEDYVINVPNLEWVNIDNSDTNITQPQQVNGTVSANRSLTFDPIRTSHGRGYTCRASIDIPLANINDRSNTDSEDVSVQIPTSVVVVNDSPFPAYNGTVFYLTGVLRLNSTVVDTDVTVVWVWSRNSEELQRWNTTTSPHQITIPFQPLSTNSSGLYHLNLTILPRNSEYVLGNSDSSTSHDLVVLRLPLPVPSIEITARATADGCSEARNFTCTATAVDNIFTQPTIEWRVRGNRVPSTGNPRMDSATGLLIFDDIMNGDYTCRADITIPAADIDSHINDITTTVSTDMPAKVQNFMCIGSPSEMSFSLTWEEPVAQGSGVVGYRVEAQRVEQQASRELISVPLTPAYDEVIEATQADVTQGLQPEVPYSITVKALNLAGCGEEQQVYCFTQEGEPPMPMNVMVVRINSTAMIVSWDKFTLVELKGFASYIITYTVGGGSRKRQGSDRMATAMWFESNKTIGGLPLGQAVGVQVHTTSTGGTSSPVTRMLEAEPTGDGLGVIIGAIIAAILVVVVIIITTIIIVILVRRHRVSKEFSLTRGMYNVGGGKSEERELQPVDNGHQPALEEKEREALEESAIVPPPTQPRSVITTEVLDRMKPVSMTSFRDHVATKHEDRDKGFESEYQSFGTDPVNSHEIAKLPINRPKNRFANIFPYDFSRVKLNDLPTEEGSDYINACSLDGYKRKECYIAAQGPMPNTINDFWRMVWERRLPNIVMLTKCLEAGRRKCEQYWADNIGEDFQTPDKKLNITTTSVMPYADFVIRTFSVKSLTDASLDPLSVTHYHFTSWPDHGVPKFATSLISFIRRVQRGHTKDSGRQLLIHCSAGVGRTGTFITLDSMLDSMAAKEPDVNVYEFVYNMRQRRVLMVQTLAQYVFIHDALNELITCGQTDVVASALRTKVNFLSKVIPAKGITGFQNQFQLLDQVSRLPVDEDITDAMEPYNQSKNRYPDKIPYNMSRARLRPTGEDGSEYINASFIDGYKQRNAYIATQGPLQSTVNDIWRMLYEFKSRTLVMLCNMNEDHGEASYPYFPSKEEEAVKYGRMLVTLQSKASYTDFIVRRFSIQEDKSSPKNDGFVVTQFHLTEWPPNNVPNTGTLIEMLDMITKNQMNTGNRPITVMCNDGVGRTGTFICIHAQLERLKTEGVVDFFQSIKSARIQRAELVPDVEQYAFCHTVLADYIDKFDNYANFKDMI